MRKRSVLQSILENILGARRVYFQPPESKKISYPCIVYELSSDLVNSANNKKYRLYDRYKVTLIDTNPDSIFVSPIREMEYCSLDSTYVADNLNHFVFTLYF